jgi:DNA-directed RNA polymerase subunit F
MRKILFLTILLAGVGMFQSCTMCSRQRTVDVYIDLVDFAIDTTYFNMARNVLYALPTPIEVSMLIRNAGVDWHPALLNDPDNASKYLTTQKMALNFGAYLTNLTYSGLFEQPQAVLRYKNAVLQLAEGLGMQSAINANTLQLIEDNINDREMLLRIIADTYASCMAYLNETDRYFLTLTVLAGGWVEGMYIATNSINENLFINERNFRQLVIDLIFTFEMIWGVMSDMQDVPGIHEIMSDMSELAKLFDRIDVHTTPNVVTVSEDTNISEIASTNIIDITPEDFENIRITLQTIRDNFTQI